MSCERVKEWAHNYACKLTVLWEGGEGEEAGRGERRGGEEEEKRRSKERRRGEREEE